MSAEALGRAAAAVLLPGFVGTEAPDWVRGWLDRGLGGVCLFSRNVAGPEQLSALTAALRAGRDDVLVAIDEEGGDVTRLELSTGSSYPGAWALGVVDDVALTERVAASIGSDLAAAGVNLNFAPVADVNTNPDNPVIGIRSFGADARLVARHVAAFVAGIDSAGVAACAKHFPGHGDTHEDSHLALPTVEPDAAAFEQALIPFRAAIDAGVPAVMTAHIRVPAIDDAPATLSRPLLEGILRGELGFEGAIVTDALEMRGVSNSVGVAEAAVLALAAGADALLLGAQLTPSNGCRRRSWPPCATGACRRSGCSRRPGASVRWAARRLVCNRLRAAGPWGQRRQHARCASRETCSSPAPRRSSSSSRSQGSRPARPTTISAACSERGARTPRW
jgi:beta-N-acetylhexosaminidase